MGTDWHPFIEEQIGDKWVLWGEPPMPDPTYWYERIIERMVDSGQVNLITGESDNDMARIKLEVIFKSLLQPEIVTKYGDDRDLIVDWIHPDGWWDFKGRDYAWFSLIAGVRGSSRDQLFDTRGFPEDCSYWVKHEADHWDADAHTHSWLMVSEILDHPKLQDFPKTDWLRQAIPNPERTRVVFWFDN